MKLTDFSLTALDGTPLPAAQLDDKVVLVVNVASQCGLTPQYRELEQLQRDLGPRGFTVLGVPCNQFGGQEPGDATQISQFCASNYDVSFPLLAKTDVNGPGRHPLYAWLADEQGGFPGNITWNFEKFLIGRDGTVKARFTPRTPPTDAAVRESIESLL
ncbi:MAG: Glutathione peroxidase [Moraxellaceae bacterium]|jgi:glutathione peroxidase|nr:Glutathione peroxidase [Moraxellaceae bacterium]